MENQQTLYLGLDLPSGFPPNTIHCPLIQIIPRPLDEVRETLAQVDQATHLIFTSKSAVRIFCDYAALLNLCHLAQKRIFAVGTMTAAELKQRGLPVNLVSKVETAEGLVAEMQPLDLREAHFFWPHSSLSRHILPDFFQAHAIACTSCTLYDTIVKHPIPLHSLDGITEIVFTSPSTIDAFLEVFGAIPSQKKLTCIGPVTQSRLNAVLMCGTSEHDRHTHSPA